MATAKRGGQKRREAKPMTLEEKPPQLIDRLHAIARSFGWDFDGLEHVADKIHEIADFAKAEVSKGRHRKVRFAP